MSKSTFSIIPDTTIFGNIQAARLSWSYGWVCNPTTYFSNQPFVGFNFKTGGTAAEGGETIQVDLVSTSGAENLSFTTEALAADDQDEIIEKVKSSL